MNCLNCGTENSDEAVFCRQCGARMDGKIICPNCSAENVADSNFCIICGQNLSQPTTTVPTPENVIPVAENQRIETTIGWKSTVSTLSGIFAMLGLLFSVLFTFFIGIKVNGSTGILDSIPSATTPNQMDIFYYFGDAYKTLDLIDTKLPDFTATSLYFPIILATVVFASLLLAMIIMGILTIVRYYFYVTKKSKKDHYSMVIATYFLYIFGVLMFFVFNNSVYSLKQNTATYSVGCGVNDLTTTGITLSTIFVCAAVGCKFALNLQNKTMTGIYNIVFSAISLIIVCVMVYLAIMPHISYDAAYDNTNGGTNFFSAITALGILYFYKSAPQYAATVLPSMGTETEVPRAESALLVVPAILQILTIVLLLVIAGGYLLNLAKDKKYSTASLSLTSTLSTTFLLIFTIISSISYWTYSLGESYETSEIKFTYVIAMLILSVVQLTISLIHRSFNNIEKKAMQEQQLQY